MNNSRAKGPASPRVNPTSIDSLRLFVLQGSNLRIKSQILGLIVTSDCGYSRKELSDTLGVRICSITKPVVDLLQEGVLVVLNKKKDITTGRTVENLGLPPQRVRVQFSVFPTEPQLDENRIAIDD